MATKTAATKKASTTTTRRAAKRDTLVREINTDALIKNTVSYFTRKEIDSINKNIEILVNKVQKDSKVAALIDSDPQQFVAKYMGFIQFPTEKKGVYVSAEEFVRDMKPAKIKVFINDVLSSGSRIGINAFLYNRTFLWTYVHFWTKTSGTSPAVTEVFGSRIRFTVPTRLYANFKNDLKKMQNMELTQSRSNALLRCAVLNPTKILAESKEGAVITRKVEYKNGTLDIRATIQLKDHECVISIAEVK